MYMKNLPTLSVLFSELSLTLLFFFCLHRMSYKASLLSFLCLCGVAVLSNELTVLKDHHQVTESGIS